MPKSSNLADMSAKLLLQHNLSFPNFYVIFD